MAQPSVAAYFNTRKRAATEDVIRSNKVLVFDGESGPQIIKNEPEKVNNSGIQNERVRVSKKLTFDSIVTQTKTMVSPRPQSVARKVRINKTADKNQKNIVQAFSEIPIKRIEISSEDAEKFYPTTPTKNKPPAEKVASGSNQSLEAIQKTLLQSSRLQKIKESLAKLKNADSKLQELEEKRKILDSPNSALKQFKTIDLDIPSSPQKVASPQKLYLSPNKNAVNSPRKNLLHLLSPNKSLTTPSSPSKLAAYQRFASLIDSGKPSFTLPYRYRCLAEQFRCLETVIAMYFNRGEVVTFKKIRGSVQEMLRKNFNLENLAQIKHVYPEAYNFTQNKIRNFGSTSKQEKYELVIIPQIPKDTETKNQDRMNSNVVLERRRKMFNYLVEQVKIYHEEFLESLDPPMKIPKDQLTRWHPEFDVERVPDIPQSPLPEPPNVERFTNAKDVLEKARQLFNCNTQMERALERLAQKQATTEVKQEPETSESTNEQQGSILKGIPPSLLEKVRARQAAKALEAMTRTPAKVKESAQYAQLPELAKYTRNIFIAERKSVLPIESVINKLNNSFRTNFTPSELEAMLKILADLLPGWLVFHEIRKAIYIKLAKDADMTKVLSKLEQIAKEKADI